MFPGLLQKGPVVTKCKIPFFVNLLIREVRNTYRQDTALIASRPSSWALIAIVR